MFYLGPFLGPAGTRAPATAGRRLGKDLPRKQRPSKEERKVRLMETIRKLSNEGYSVREMAEKTGLAKSTVHRRLKEVGQRGR